MEPATALPQLSFKKKLRSGQRRVLDHLAGKINKLLAKLPTGYGKTYLGFCIYAIKQMTGSCNRMLIITGAPDQSRQMVTDGPLEAANACVSGPRNIMDVSFWALGALVKALREDKCSIFTIHIHDLNTSEGMQKVQALMQTGRWMVWVDEYHHYGQDKRWTDRVNKLGYMFFFGTSATPDRPGKDGAFGPPDVSVKYREAVEERAVKPLRGHAYNYAIEFDVDGETVRYTTKELAEQAGGDDPDKISTYTLSRKMRWKPDYISPLLYMPIDRMLTARIACGRKLQALGRAMCVAHAKLICEQARILYPELAIEWVGTGTDGRTDEENTSVLARFCPPKDEHGNRPPSTIDVLISVGMCAEAKDTVDVSEVMIFDNGGLSNTLIQIIGRAARAITGVTGHVNFDASSGLAKAGYIGAAIMDAMDFDHPEPDDDEDTKTGDGDGDYIELPPEPVVDISRLQLIEVDSGDDGVRQMAKLIQSKNEGFLDFSAMEKDGAHADWQTVINLFNKMREVQAAPLKAEAIVRTLDEDLKSAVRKVTGLVVEKLGFKRGRAPGWLVGVVKHEINAKKSALHGPVCNDEEVLRKHYGFVKQLERDVLNNGAPRWAVALQQSK